MYPKVQFHPAHTHARNLPSTASNSHLPNVAPRVEQMLHSDHLQWQRPSSVIKWVAQRIQKCPEGQFPASPPPMGPLIHKNRYNNNNNCYSTKRTGVLGDERVQLKS